MDIVTAVNEYSHLLNIEYHLILGRKGKSQSVKIVFDKTAWFHVAGIHYLKDIDINQNRKSSAILYDDIMNGSIMEEYFKKSEYYETISDRVELLSKLGEIIEGIDNTNISIYGFSKTRAKFYTTIDGDYLISDLRNADEPINLFLVFERIADGILVPATAFHPGTDKRSGKPLDYTAGQMKYTLLKNARYQIQEDILAEVFCLTNYKEEKVTKNL